MMNKVHLGTVEIGEDSIFHSAYPHLMLSMPITSGTAFPQGTVLQIDAVTHQLEAGDLSTRSYIAASDIVAEDTVALVGVLGAVRFEKVILAGNPITTNEALSLMEKSPLAVI